MSVLSDDMTNDVLQGLAGIKSYVKAMEEKMANKDLEIRFLKEAIDRCNVEVEKMRNVNNDLMAARMLIKERNLEKLQWEGARKQLESKIASLEKAVEDRELENGRLADEFEAKMSVALAESQEAFTDKMKKEESVHEAAMSAMKQIMDTEDVRYKEMKLDLEKKVVYLEDQLRSQAKANPGSKPGCDASCKAKLTDARNYYVSKIKSLEDQLRKLRNGGEKRVAQVSPFNETPGKRVKRVTFEDTPTVVDEEGLAVDVDEASPSGDASKCNFNIPHLDLFGPGNSAFKLPKVISKNMEPTSTPVTSIMKASTPLSAKKRRLYDNSKTLL